MCFIGQPINYISNTKIIIIANSSEQITIYSNCINNIYDDNVMIIPVPNPESVSFIDIDSINSLLLEYIIDNDKDDSDYIIDNYYTKIYNNIDELLNANNKDFLLSSYCINELHSYSGSTSNSNKLWGFIVCKLNKGNIKYMPIAYKHKMITNHAYIPTRVYYKSEYLYSYINIYEYLPFYNYYSWDHEICLINTKGTVLLNSISSERSNKKLNLPINLSFNNILNLKNNINIEKYIIKGKQLNIDFFIYNL